MPQLDLPEFIMVHSNCFIAFLIDRGMDQEWEPHAAVPLMNTQGLTVILNDGIPEDTMYVRKNRQWFKVKTLTLIPV